MSTLRTSTSQKAGLSAVMDKKHESDGCVCGTWSSAKGESSIFRDCNMTASPSRNLWMTRDTCTVGLDRNRDRWQARLAFYDMDEELWCSPSCGEEPEHVGDIHVRLLSETGDRNTDQVF